MPSKMAGALRQICHDISWSKFTEQATLNYYRKFKLSCKDCNSRVFPGWIKISERSGSDKTEKKIWPIWTPKSENGSDGNNGETTRCNLRLGLIITPHRNINNTNRYISTDFGQIRSELIESSIKGFQFLTSTVKASKQTRFYSKKCFWLATISS